MGFGASGDDFDLEIEAIQPGHADCGHGRMRRIAPELREHQIPYRLELRLRIDDEYCHVDHVVEAASGSVQDRIEILEGAPYLGFQIRFRRTVLGAANLPLDKQKAIRTHGWGIAIALVKCLAASWENYIALSHGCLHQ